MALIGLKLLVTKNFKPVPPGLFYQFLPNYWTFSPMVKSSFILN
jgi:hypothetical protein